MRTKQLAVIFCLLWISALFAACAAHDNGVQAGIVPDIQTFSGSDYEAFEFHFPPVDYALFYHDDTVDTISPEDPKLIRLLNFIAFSSSNSLSWVRQGYIPEDEMVRHYDHWSRIEVFFRSVSPSEDEGLAEDPHVILTPRIIIAKNVVFEYASNNTDIDEYWPYLAIYWSKAENGEISKEAFENEMYGETIEAPWIDLIKLSGFES